MTRKEEINDFIANYLEQYNGDSYEAYAEKEDVARACQNAIDWADRTMLVKACEWLKENMGNYIIEHPFFPSGSSVTIEEDKMVEDFRKAMEGE